MSRYQGWKLEERGYIDIEIYGIGDPKLGHIIQGMPCAERASTSTAGASLTLSS